MARNESKPNEIGDVVELTTSRGLAYCQHTHYHEEWGALVRGLPGIFEQRPTDFSAVVNQASQFRTFFPLEAAIKRGIVKVVAHLPVPDDEAEFPLFRTSGLPDSKTMRASWSLWDGVSEWPIRRLTRKYRKLPVLGIVNDAALVYFFETGWTAEMDIGQYSKGS